MDRPGEKAAAHVIIKRVEIGYQKFAILMGVREYLWDPHWEAGFVDRDLAGLKDVLVRQGYRVRTVVNPTIDQTGNDDPAPSLTQFRLYRRRWQSRSPWATTTT